MNTTNETKTKEEDIEGCRFEEPLDKGLLSIFDFVQTDNFYARTNPKNILIEAYHYRHSVEKDMLDDNDFHKAYEDMKRSLGSYYAASICMVMLYALLSVKSTHNFQTLCLIHKIENKYKLRSWMKEVAQLVYRIKNNIPNNNDMPIIIKLEDNRAGSEKKALNITLNINNEYTGEIKQMQVAHSDVVVGVAEKGSNVFHHKEVKEDGRK